MKLTNKQELPAPIVRAVANDGYSKGRADFSITQLLQPPRKVQLERRYDDQLTEDAADRLWSLIGQVSHGILERAEVEAVAEKRLYAEINGYTVSGAMDRLVLVQDGETGENVLQDYKVTTVYGVKIEGGPKPEWVQQLNGYVELLAANGYRIDRAEVVAIYRDWSKLEAKRQGHEYPQQQAQRLPVEVWTPKTRLEFLSERVAEHAAATAASDDDLPLCSDDDRWAKPGKVAVYKVGNKTASRVVDSIEAAVDWLIWKGEVHDFVRTSTMQNVRDGHLIPGKSKTQWTAEFRPPSFPRCESYCAAAPVCAQWAQVCAEHGWEHPLNQQEAAE